MNLLKEKLNPNSEYNKKLRRDGNAMVKEMYKEAIECLEDCIKNQPCECRNEMRLAIEALEKQIPKKPIPIDWEQYKDKIINAKYLRGGCWCPNCKHMIRSGEYCPDCGQKLDWGNAE